MSWLIAMLLTADPGWGIVRTQTGTVFATDVIRNVIWSIDASGRVSAAVRDRHAHGLLLDEAQALIGDQTDYDPETQRFSRWAWRLEGRKLVRLASVPKGLDKPASLPAHLPRTSGWEVSGYIENSEFIWMLEHIPMKEFEGIHTRQASYLQVRRFDKRTGASLVLLSVSRSAP